MIFQTIKQPITVRVPQGSKLGHIQFNFCTSDIPQSPCTNLALFTNTVNILKQSIYRTIVIGAFSNWFVNNQNTHHDLQIFR